MPNKTFLETYPLYRRFPMVVPVRLEHLAEPPINLECHQCKSSQTFRMRNNYWDSHELRNITDPRGATCHLKYGCTACAFIRHFYVTFDEKGKWAMKVGQFPAWDISMDKDLEKALGDRSQLYSRALVCESISYGVGAFAYYRQIVEDVIDVLLEDIGELIPSAEQKAYANALAKAKATHVTQEKIDLVKDLLPPILRPEGMNPLSALHRALSEGLHAGTDDDCVALSATIREVLVFLVHQVAVTKNNSKKFSESMRKLLSKDVADSG